jgi:hybrid cluster-associated redox disulfide protein
VRNNQIYKENTMSQDKISKDMTFGDLLRRFPGAAQILMNYGMHCIGCHIAVTETLGEGALAHGMDNKMIEQMIRDLNSLAAN